MLPRALGTFDGRLFADDLQTEKLIKKRINRLNNKRNHSWLPPHMPVKWMETKEHLSFISRSYYSLQ